MGQIDSRGGLAIAELVFYSPALLFSLAVYAKQGLVNIGWLYLCIICILRLIGGSVTLYIETQNAVSVSLYETAAITSAVGLTPLLLTWVVILKRIHKHIGQGYSQHIFHLIHIIAITALALAIVGGVDSVDSSSSDYKTGRACAKAASIIFLVVYLALAVITILTATQKRSSIASSENKLLIAAICVLPFLLVRVIYTTASFFSTPSSVFYFLLPNIYVESFMMFAMEAITVLFFLWAGLFSPRIASVASYDHNVEAYGMKPNGADAPYTRQTETRVPAPRSQERSVWDYRPSRLIRNAMSNRN